MVSKDLIYDLKLDNKRVLLFSHFYIKRGLDNVVGFSCNSLVKWCGYIINNHTGKINETITLATYQLVNKKYIDINGTMNKNNYCSAIVNEEMFDEFDQFALIHMDEIEKIREFKKYTKDISRMNPAILILVLSYIRVNMLRRQDGYIGNLADKPEFCYRLYKNIATDIGISARYISRAVGILNELDIIVSQEMPRYQDEKNNWHTGVTMFVNRYRRERKTNNLDETYNYVDELAWGKKYINDKSYLTKKFNQEL